jgi:hypothetical protein
MRVMTVVLLTWLWSANSRLVKLSRSTCRHCRVSARPCCVNAAPAERRGEWFARVRTMRSNSGTYIWLLFAREGTSYRKQRPANHMREVSDAQRAARALQAPYAPAMMERATVYMARSMDSTTLVAGMSTTWRGVRAVSASAEARAQRELRRAVSLSDLARLAALVRQRQLLQAAAARASARTTDTQSPRAAQPQQGAFLAPWRRGTGQLSRERAHGRQHIVDRLQALPPCRRAELSDKHLQRQRRRCVPSNAAASAGSCSAPLRRPLMPPADVSSTQATRRLSERADGGIRRRGGGGDFDASSARGAAREDQRTHRRPYFSGGSVPRRLATPPGRLQTAR